MTAGALKVGLLGAGAIGQVLGDGARSGAKPRGVLVAIADQDRGRAEKFAAQLKARPPVVEIDELVRRSDLIIEAASQAALPEIVPRALRAQKDLMVMSVGGLLETRRVVCGGGAAGLPDSCSVGCDRRARRACGRRQWGA